MEGGWRDFFHQTDSQSRWGIVLLKGLAALVAGLLLVSSPGTATLVLVQFLGFYWLAVGVMDLVEIFTDPRMWGWKLVSGLLGIVAGLIVLRHPMETSVLVPATVVIILGLEALVIGALGLIRAFRGDGLGAGVLATLNVVLGLVLLVSPAVAAFWLPVILGVCAIGGGIGTVAAAYGLRSAKSAA